MTSVTAAPDVYVDLGPRIHTPYASQHSANISFKSSSSSGENYLEVEKAKTLKSEEKAVVRSIVSSIKETMEKEKSIKEKTYEEKMKEIEEYKAEFDEAITKINDMYFKLEFLCSKIFLKEINEVMAEIEKIITQINSVMRMDKKAKKSKKKAKKQILTGDEKNLDKILENCENYGLKIMDLFGKELYEKCKIERMQRGGHLTKKRRRRTRRTKKRYIKKT